VPQHAGIKDATGALIQPGKLSQKTVLSQAVLDRSGTSPKIGFTDLPNELLLAIGKHAAVKEDGYTNVRTLIAMRATSHLMKAIATEIGNKLPLSVGNTRERSLEGKEFVLPRKHFFTKLKKNGVGDRHSISPHPGTYAMVKSFPGMTDFTLYHCVDADLNCLPESLKKLSIHRSSRVTTSALLSLSKRLLNLTSLRITDANVGDEVALAFATRPNIQYLNFVDTPGARSYPSFSQQGLNKLKEIAKKTGKTIVLN
jgi:hypothetical protein